MNDDFEHIRHRLASRIAKWTEGTEKYDTEISGLCMYHHEQPGASVDCMLEPAIALPVQGGKRTRFGTEAYSYDRSRFLITSLNLPVAMQVVDASPSMPYLSVVLRLDANVIGELIMESKLLTQNAQQKQLRAMAIGHTTAALLNSFDRLLALLDEPESIPVLFPLIQREIFYRILKSDVGHYLFQMAAGDSQSQRISLGIEWLKANFREHFRIDELAARVQMSPSRLHHHFRYFTSMSPLQFQKWLRLVEARRLMLIQGLDASSAAFEVGYESPSQFSREYSRQFGASPRKDIEKVLQKQRY